MNLRELQAAVNRLASVFTDGRIQRIFMPNGHDLALDIRTPGDSRWLLISLHPRLGRIHEIAEKPDAPQTPPAFCMALRKHLVGGRIIELAASPDDRIVSLWVERGEDRAGIIAEFFGPSANAFLIGGDEAILDVLSRKKAAIRNLNLQDPYEPPPSPRQIPEMKERDFGDDIEAYFEKLETELAFDEKKRQLLSPIVRQLKRSDKYLVRMAQDLETLDDPARLRKWGDLLAISVREARRGMEKIEVFDIFEPGAPPLAIALDPKKNGPENVEHLYRQAGKNKKRIQGLQTRIEEIRQAQTRLLEIRQEVESAQCVEDLEQIDDRLPGLGIERTPPVRGRKKKQESTGPREFVSADGVKILVGRNARENDEMTFRIARGNDYWLHVLGEAGTHVVVLMEKSGELKQETLLDAATLAILHSRLKTQGRGDVIYTRRKYVSKPKGAPPGRVTHSQSKTIHIKIEDERVERLMGKRVLNY